VYVQTSEKQDSVSTKHTTLDQFQPTRIECSIEAEAC
jgi:hypothetical protein